MLLVIINDFRYNVYSYRVGKNHYVRAAQDRGTLASHANMNRR